MSIRGDVEELKMLDVEIKRLNKQTTDLRKHRNEVKSRIDLYLREKDQPGVKWGDITIRREETEKRMTKGRNKKDKEDDVIAVLTKNGISDPKRIFEEVAEAMKGPKVTTSDIKIKKIKQNK
jgi:seryl-tRNA synthetase